MLQLILSIGPALLATVTAAFVDSICLQFAPLCDLINSFKAFFLAGVKNLWLVYCVFKYGCYPINLFSVLYQSKLNTFGV